MRSHLTPSDEELLASGASEAFAVFYDRHARSLLGYFARRTRDPQAAADLTAETFASAIASQARYDSATTTALAWLYTIAGRRLADYHRRGAVESRMRDALAMRTPRVTEEDAAMISLLADEAVGDLLDALPDEQRVAVEAHVLEDRGYAELAGELHTSEAAVRQRVSRGLSALRRRIGGAA